MFHQVYNQQPYPYVPQKSVDGQVRTIPEQLLFHIFEFLQVEVLLS